MKIALSLLVFCLVSCGNIDLTAKGTANVNHRFVIDIEICDEALNPVKRWQCVETILKIAEEQSAKGCIDTNE